MERDGGGDADENALQDHQNCGDDPYEVVLAGPGCHDVNTGRHWYSSFVTERVVEKR